jgi:hypothetical protein
VERRCIWSLKEGHERAGGARLRYLRGLCSKGCSAVSGILKWSSDLIYDWYCTITNLPERLSTVRVLGAAIFNVAE